LTPVRAEWSTYQGNITHNGYVPGAVAPAKITLVWKDPISPYALGGLAVGGSAVYVKGPSVSITAVNQQTGAALWSNPYTFGVSKGQVYTTSAPAYANGMVYYQTDNEVGYKP